MYYTMVNNLKRKKGMHFSARYQGEAIVQKVLGRFGTHLVQLL